MAVLLLDLRSLQAGGAGAAAAAALLGAAAAGVPGWRLVGLADPALPALPDPVAALLDTVRGAPAPDAAGPAACLVQLSPGHDPVFVAPLLLHPLVTAVALPLPPAAQGAGPAARIAHAVAAHWHRHYDMVLDGADPHRFWTCLGALAARKATRPAPHARTRRPRIAWIDPAPDPDLLEALAAHAEIRAFRAPPAASALAGVDRMVGVVANAPAYAPVAALLARQGGTALIRDAGLQELYGDAALAEAELGRSLWPGELDSWARGGLPPRASFLAPLARGADALLVHSEALACRIRRRFGRAALVVPAAVAARAPDRAAARRRLGLDPAEFVLAAVADPGTEANTVWALELLLAWGVPARLHLVGPPPPSWPHERALAARLDLAGRIALMPQRHAALHWAAADVGLMLALRPSARVSAALQVACVQGLPCVASAGMARAVALPDWVRTIPDQPSPVLLAEAALAAAAAAPDAAQARACALRHTPARAAAALCAALGL